jgi:hypothetical protein
VTRRPWTGAEQLRLRELAGTLPKEALAERFGRTVPAIHAALWKLRGRVTPVPPVEPRVDPRVHAAAARALAAEIKRARDESATTAPYRPGPLLW